MDEGTVSESIPDLKDIEAKIGRKTPEGLLRWMREESSSLRADAKLALAHDAGKETGMKSLDEKIRKLKMEMVRIHSSHICARRMRGRLLFSRMCHSRKSARYRAVIMTMNAEPGSAPADSLVSST